MQEQLVVDAVVSQLSSQGFLVSTEVPNFHRSADIAAVDQKGDVWVIECKISALARAVTQSRTHQLAADHVLIATPFRNTRAATIEKLQNAGVGLLYVMPDGGVEEAYEPPRVAKPWRLARENLRKAIMEEAK